MYSCFFAFFTILCYNIFAKYLISELISSDKSKKERSDINEKTFYLNTTN